MSFNNQLSVSNIKRAVRRATLQHPALLYPLTFALITLLAGLLEFIDQGFILAALGAGIGLGNLAVQALLRKDYHAGLYISSVRDKLAAERDLTLKRLEANLAQLDQVDAAKQLTSLENKYRNFVAILETKLAKSELTYIRYLTICEQVYLGALDNLDDVCNTVRSVSAIDITGIEAQLADMQQLDKVTQTQLRMRHDLYHQQMNKIVHLLSVNQVAMTKLDTVTVSLSELKTQQGRASMQIDESLTELQTLILSTHNYSH